MYLARAGVSRNVLPGKGVSVSFGLRTDGVPSRDLIDGNDGYRLPGYSISIEPGVSISHGKNFFSLTVPVAVKGHGSKAPADIRTNNPVGGTVTLAGFECYLNGTGRMRPIAPPGQEGWLCHKENIAKQLLSAQTGWLFKLEQNI